MGREWRTDRRLRTSTDPSQAESLYSRGHSTLAHDCRAHAVPDGLEVHEATSRTRRRSPLDQEADRERGQAEAGARGPPRHRHRDPQRRRPGAVEGAQVGRVGPVRRRFREAKGLAGGDRPKGIPTTLRVRSAGTSCAPQSAAKLLRRLAIYAFVAKSRGAWAVAYPATRRARARGSGLARVSFTAAACMWSSRRPRGGPPASARDGAGCRRETRGPCSARTRRAAPSVPCLGGPAPQGSHTRRRTAAACTEGRTGSAGAASLRRRSLSGSAPPTTRRVALSRRPRPGTSPCCRTRLERVARVDLDRPFSTRKRPRLS